MYTQFWSLFNTYSRMLISFRCLSITDMTCTFRLFLSLFTLFLLLSSPFLFRLHINFRADDIFRQLVLNASNCISKAILTRNSVSKTNASDMHTGGRRLRVQSLQYFAVAADAQKYWGVFRCNRHWNVTNMC